ncbi:MAG: tetratricopeptide repeat protein [Tunicatimonas sp.]
MKAHVLVKYYILFWGGVVLALSGCAPEKNGLVAGAYHNTTAHYNAYFYARLRMDEIQQAIADQQEDNYNKILRVLPSPDTAFISGLNEPIEDCIKKASVAIERHPNSQWADDSYILIGMCRDFRQNYGDAIKTYKFVNTESEDDAARHEALVKLMHTFTKAQEQNNAVAVADYLRKEELNRENKVRMHLVKADLAQRNEDYNVMVGNLLIAAPQMKKSEGRARIYFILGQLYQQLGFAAQAYDNYREALKSNPEYELYFYTRLNMAQVTNLSDGRDVKKIRKFFRKLLRDDKNEEYRDKIYYEMASFELRQGNLEKAVEYYDESVRASVNNNRQKGYSYLALGQIYYDSLEDYRTAKLYYDSTVSVLPADEDNYAAVTKRQEILTNFVEQITIIEVQDSLLKLAQMDSSQLMALIDGIIEEQQREQRRQERLARREAQSGQAASSFNQMNSPFGTPGGTSSAATQAQGSEWYFYNPAAISQGQSAFARQWGQRPLADNWRRAQRQAAPGGGTPTAPDGEIGEVADALPTDSTRATAAVDGLPAEESGERAALYANIPFTEEQQQASLAMVEEAHYALGGIYNFDLEEKSKAIETFETLLKRFPASEHTPEVLYLLYLIYQELDDATYQKYRDRVLNEFPDSIYAKLIKNPNYEEESNLASEQLKKLYQKAYTQYQRGNYDSAQQQVRSGLARYGDNDFTDNATLLSALIKGKTDGEYEYQLALQRFLEEFPESDVHEYASQLLAGIDAYKQKIEARRGTEYIAEFDEEHSFVVVYTNIKKLSTELPKAVDTFNQQYFAQAGLTSANLMLEDGKVMILIEKFPDKESSEQYYTAFNGENSPLKNLPPEYTEQNIETSFAISADNLTILYRTKDVDRYAQFFKNHYMK